MHSEAKELYYFLSTISYDYGLIDIFTLHERVNFLNDDNSQTEENIEIVISQKQNESNQTVLSFTTNISKTIRTTWDFILGDPDHKPSIPHGHSNKNHQINLDPYLGHIYNMSTSANQGRETRAFINALWNDQKFRDFALKQINWFINFNHNFKWRVSNPHVLPRRRP